MTPDYPSIRIRPELRAEHVKRAARMSPALTLYFDEKYDLGTTKVPDRFQRVTLAECLRILALTDSNVLEVPEPLWLRFAFRNFAILAVWKFFGLLRRKRRVSVTYAIENNALSNLLWPSGRLRPLAERLAAIALGVFIRSALDRIAFGSAASKALYQSLPSVSRVPHQLVEELPGRPTAAAPNQDANQGRAIFIGILDDRKGILDVMAAWPAVERTLPEAVLRIVGDGKHAPEVSRWCSERPESRIFEGFLQHDEIPSLLAASDVIVAPSRRAGRWREQIGLPIIEGLSFGLTVVTTDETGLASWLQENGHVVLPEGTVREGLSGQLARALQAPLPRDQVLASLPEIPGRIAADAWLHGALTGGPREENLNESR